jgi:hypothetical protein
MIADIFYRTDLSDAAVAQIRLAIETLGQWALKWNQEHKSHTLLRLDYKVIMPAGVNGNGNGNGATGGIEWKLSETGAGILTETFFKSPSAAQTVGGGGGGGLMGWGGISLTPSAKTAAPAAPPAAWLQVLAKTGAARFEKDSAARTVRFTRTIGPSGNGEPAPSSVPVVEIDGTRYPTRNRDEALAAKRK